MQGLFLIERNSIGFKEQEHHTDGMATITRTFTPEFRNRLDAIIQFEPLNEVTITRVVDKFIDELMARLKEKENTVGSRFCCA